MSSLRPESRIKSLENRATDIEAKIEEMSADTAESLNALQQNTAANFEAVRDDIKQGFDQAHTFIKENIESRLEAMATKQDISTLETRLSKIEATQEQILKLLQQKGS